MGPFKGNCLFLPYHLPFGRCGVRRDAVSLSRIVCVWLVCILCAISHVRYTWTPTPYKTRHSASCSYQTT